MKFRDFTIKHDKVIAGIRIFLIVFIFFMQYYQFQKGMFPSSIKLGEQGIFLLLNLTLIIIFNLLILLVIKRWHITLLISSLILYSWSIVNHYVYEFHGSPLFFSTLRNAGEGMDVIGDYNFSITTKIVYILICFVITIFLISGLWCLSRKRVPTGKRCRGNIAVLLVLIAFVVVFMSGFFNNVGNVKLGFSWSNAIRDQGFLCCCIEDFTNVMNPIEKPVDYSSKELDVEHSYAKLEIKETSPNVILILNETFSDLKIETDLDYMSPLKKIENANNGTAVAPMIGGGTNNSEYELLTSNSMFLLKSEAPFNYLDFENNTSNIVQYLERFGYKTTGMHCASKTNYSRQKAYPDLGFDSVFLGEDAFENKGTYGNREWLDSDNYKDLISAYEKNIGKPQFIYMLTMQNHGGWEQNEDSYDLVHVKDDYGDLTDDLNEYLTSVHMSAKAFAELTEHFENVDEPTIIAMVGDHAPSFINQLTSQGVANEKNDVLTGRTVPYIIWANYDIEYPTFNEYISMTDFVPMIIDSANLPMSTYYQHIREMQKEIPVRLNTGQYIDKTGNVEEYNEDSPYYDMLSKYYYMEYNSIIGGEDYQKELFEPPIGK